MDTLSRWASVRCVDGQQKRFLNLFSRGEDLHIFPFMKNADTVFNTALDYEVSVLKTFCKPLLKSVKPNSPSYNMAQFVLTLLCIVTKLGNYLNSSLASLLYHMIMFLRILYFVSLLEEAFSMCKGTNKRQVHFCAHFLCKV